MFSKLFGSLMISFFSISIVQAKLTPQQVSEKLKTIDDLSTTELKKKVLNRADSAPVLSKEETTKKAPVAKKGHNKVPEKRKTGSTVKPPVKSTRGEPQINVAGTIKHKKRSPAVPPKAKNVKQN